MTYPPQQPGGWSDPNWPQQQPQPANPYDPGGQPVSGQPVSGGQAPYSGYGYPAYGTPGYGPAASPPTNGLAIAALVCSLAGLFTCVSAPVGAILGHIARRQIRERGEAGDGMALAGIIVGWILTVLGILGCGAWFAFVIWAAEQETALQGGLDYFGQLLRALVAG